MFSIILAILGAIPVIGPVVKAWADHREQANRPDIIKAQTATVVQEHDDKVRGEESAAMSTRDPATEQKALDALRQEAAE